MEEKERRVLPTMVNIGSEREPAWVPRKALEPTTPEGREWWGMVAEGSVVLEAKVLDLLIRKTDVKKD